MQARTPPPHPLTHKDCPCTVLIVEVILEPCSLEKPAATKEGKQLSEGTLPSLPSPGFPMSFTHKHIPLRTSISHLAQPPCSTALLPVATHTHTHTHTARATHSAVVDSSGVEVRRNHVVWVGTHGGGAAAAAAPPPPAPSAPSPSSKDASWKGGRRLMSVVGSST